MALISSVQAGIDTSVPGRNGFPQLDASEAQGCNTAFAGKPVGIVFKNGEKQPGESVFTI